MDIMSKATQIRVLKLKEVGFVLRIGRVSALRLVHSGKLPAFRVGRDWRILKTDLDRFMRTGSSSEPIAIEQKDL